MDDTTVVVNAVPVVPVTENAFDNYGAELGIAYMLVPKTFEPYFKYEYITFDDDYFFALPDNDVNIFTVGFNWYQAKHNAKFTMDMVYSPDSLAGAFGNSTSLGINDDFDGGDGQIALRAQYQLQW